MGGVTRRESLALIGSSVAAASLRATPESLKLATFQTEVTVPLGHALMGGGIAPAKSIEDPLFAHGIVLIGAGKPIAIVSVDWCEIRNDAYSEWRQRIAEAIDTDPNRVLVSCIHQHDAPVADLEAERFLIAHKRLGSVCDLAFHDRTTTRVAAAAKLSLKNARPLTHIGTGKARVEDVASNRRTLNPDGTPNFGRMSATRDANLRSRPEGTIDPFLRSLSFWDGEQPLAALSCYATHPMSYYGRGGVSADFIGIARRRWQADNPAIFQLYASGCSGNVIAGKYNDGSPENRPRLAERIYRAMNEAFKNSKRTKLKSISFRSVPYRLPIRSGPGYSVEELTKRLQADGRPFSHCLAAMGLSWRKRYDAGHELDLPVLDFGGALLLLLPGESYVEYQLLAQRLRPDAFVVTLGYGECATGYVPTETAFRENDSNLHDWCWVAPGSEAILTAAMKKALAV
jgi:hypothetical protein